MPETIKLQGEFDVLLKQSQESLEGTFRKLRLEQAKPTNWTAAQVETLLNLYNGVGLLANAVAILARQVRDD